MAPGSGSDIQQGERVDDEAQFFVRQEGKKSHKEQCGEGEEPHARVCIQPQGEEQEAGPQGAGEGRVPVPEKRQSLGHSLRNTNFFFFNN